MKEVEKLGIQDYIKNKIQTKKEKDPLITIKARFKPFTSLQIFNNGL